MILVKVWLPPQIADAMDQARLKAKIRTRAAAVRAMVRLFLRYDLPMSKETLDDE
jgi:metal-responsive CopG/Arc/MetJ family transcriptional regulator